MFGKNIVISQYIEPSGALKIVDLFYTIQGEGPYNGMPSVFVRLAGCNLRCYFCDTNFETGAVVRDMNFITI
jgi:7-carboxy-7-deazaguanine synthase